MTESVNLSTELLDKIKVICMDENISLENLLEVLIINFLVEKGCYEDS